MENSNDDVRLDYNPNPNKKNITVKEYRELEENKDKEAIADFIYNRLYNRYIKPFEYDNETYKREYKNGFSMMASFCLLIETLESFKKGEGNSDGESKNFFKGFFENNKNFKELEGKGDDIYTNIRSGIFHQGETTNGWIIRRDKTKISYEKKIINANFFKDKLKQSLKDYIDLLKNEEWNSGDLLKNARMKINFIIENTKKD